MNTPLILLNKLTPNEFLRDYWQKKPLLIRGAIPNFIGLLSPNELAGLACEDEVQARLIQHNKGKWHIKHGPFDDDDFLKLPQDNWTLLVQNVNHHLSEATNLLSLFNFIPHARLDDLMVSYAPDGGGVGAHFDSYDVFLLQGSGKRKWKISSQKDLSLLEDAPLRILKNFISEQEWILEAGDMLYLPPQIAHWGTAVGKDCMTYSIGFRAPKLKELQNEFLNYLQDHIKEGGIYADPDLRLQAHPAEIDEAMVKNVASIVNSIQWNKELVGDFLGRYLSEPKQDVFFVPPKKISLSKFVNKLADCTIKLNLKSQLLFYRSTFYLNGEVLNVPELATSSLQALADKRFLITASLSNEIHQCLANTLFDAYLAGFINCE